MLMFATAVGWVQTGVAAVAIFDELPGCVAVPLLVAISEGFLAEPTAPGVAPDEDWNGVLLQEDMLGMDHRPSL